MSPPTQLQRHHSPAVCVLDLEDDALAEKVQQTVTSIWGRVDILINNAGMSFRGAVAETKSEVDKKLMVVNHFGHIEVTKGDKLFLCNH